MRLNLSIFKKALPWLASAIPGGGLVSKIAFDAIGKALNVPPPADADAATELLHASATEQIAALKQAEQDFATRMRELGIKEVADLAKLANEDRASARSREIAVKDWTPRILAYAVTVGFFGLLAVLAWRGVPAGDSDVFYVLTGSLGTGWVSIVSYYFGSSAGSVSKNAVIAEQLSQK